MWISLETLRKRQRRETSASGPKMRACGQRGRKPQPDAGAWRPPRPARAPARGRGQPRGRGGAPRRITPQPPLPGPRLGVDVGGEQLKGRKESARRGGTQSRPFAPPQKPTRAQRVIFAPQRWKYTGCAPANERAPANGSGGGGGQRLAFYLRQSGEGSAPPGARCSTRSARRGPEERPSGPAPPQGRLRRATLGIPGRSRRRGRGAPRNRGPGGAPAAPTAPSAARSRARASEPETEPGAPGPDGGRAGPSSAGATRGAHPPLPRRGA